MGSKVGGFCDSIECIQCLSTINIHLIRSLTAEGISILACMIFGGVLSSSVSVRAKISDHRRGDANGDLHRFRDRIIGVRDDDAKEVHDDRDGAGE